MDTQTIDLRQVLGLIAEYGPDQQLVSPDKPFEVKATFFPGAASNIHTHPYQDEYYTIHEGELELYLDGKWRVLKAGQQAHIPKNAVHGFRNSSAAPAYLTNIHSPGLDFGASLVAMEALAKEGKITGVSGFKNLAYLAQHSLRFKDTIVSVTPPMALLRVMAVLGAVAGYKLPEGRG